MSKLENMMDMVKLNDLLGKKEEKKSCNVLLWVLAIVGAVAAVAALAYGVYRYLTPDYLDDVVGDFEDDFEDEEDDDDFFEDESEK